MVSCNSGRGFTSDLSKGTIVLPMSSLLQEREKEKEREKENGFVKEMENENEKFEWDWSSWIEFLVSGGLSAARRFDTLYAQKKEVFSFSLSLFLLSFSFSFSSLFYLLSWLKQKKI